MSVNLLKDIKYKICKKIDTVLFFGPFHSDSRWGGTATTSNLRHSLFALIAMAEEIPLPYFQETGRIQ